MAEPDGFTFHDDAAIAVVQARHEALAAGLPAVTPAHLALGVLHTLPAAVQESLVPDPAGFTRLCRALGGGADPAPPIAAEVGYQDATREVILAARALAGPDPILPAHLLAALLARRELPTARALAAAGVDPARLAPPPAPAPAAPTLLSLPGLGSSGPAHWQTLWEQRVPAIRRIEQGEWESPEPAAWMAALVRAVDEAPDGPVLLLGHSLGALLIARWAQAAVARPVAAVLVAPADPERDAAPAPLRRFAPAPVGPMTIPALVIASSDDEYLAIDRARALAGAWGAELAEVGALGHINSASGLGAWPAGWRLATDFAARLGLALPAWG